MKPCHHRIHNRCWVKYSDEREMPCPYCGDEIQEQESLFGRQNKKCSMEDRARVLRAEEEGRDWQSVSESLDFMDDRGGMDTIWRNGSQERVTRRDW